MSRGKILLHRRLIERLGADDFARRAGRKVRMLMVPVWQILCLMGVTDSLVASASMRFQGGPRGCDTVAVAVGVQTVGRIHQQQSLVWPINAAYLGLEQ